MGDNYGLENSLEVGVGKGKGTDNEISYNPSLNNGSSATTS